MRLTKKRKAPEHTEQVKAVAWLRNEVGDNGLVFSIPNGELRHPRVAARLKAEGALAGAADLCIVLAGKVLFIEMKAKGGRLSDVQMAFRAKATRAKMSYGLCRSLEDVVSTFTHWRYGTVHD